MRAAVCLTLVYLIVSSSLGNRLAFAAETGQITGQLIDSRDQRVSVGHAAVFLCDAVTGRPLVQDSFRPLGSDGAAVRGLAGLAHAVTDDHGSFEFKDVPAGKYRLVAQSWLGFAGVPDQEDPSELVHLHGVKDHVEVKGNETVNVFVRPLGTARMTLVNDPEEEHAFLVLSTAPRRGDPVLAFPFWGENFANHAIGVTLMESHQVTFHGLPNVELHAGLFNYDNNPGVGGATFRVVDGGTTRIPIYATWSNGKYDPPPSLLPLVEHLERRQITLGQLLRVRYANEFATAEGNQDPNQNRKLDPEFAVLLKHGDERFAVEGFGEVRILDLAAADIYRELRRHHQRRREAATNNRQPDSSAK